MHSKLTLRIEEPLIKAAKRYSKAHGKSLSQLVADYLLLVTESDSTESKKGSEPPISLSLKGILSGKKIDEDEYKKYLKKKFL